MAAHLSIIERDLEPTPIVDSFPIEQFLQMRGKLPWYSNLVNYLILQTLPSHITQVQMNKLKIDAKYYVWDDSCKIFIATK